MLSHCRYLAQAKVMSDNFRDQPRSPLAIAMHWVKHVAKNKGAPHLRSVAVELPFYALYNLDVWAFISITIVLAMVLCIRFARIGFMFVAPSKKKLKKN